MTNFQASSESHSAADHRRAVTGQPLPPALTAPSSLPGLGPLGPREENGGSSRHLTSKVQKTTPDHLRRRLHRQRSPSGRSPSQGDTSSGGCTCHRGKCPNSQLRTERHTRSRTWGWIPDYDEELRVPVMFANSQVGGFSSQATCKS